MLFLNNAWTFYAIPAFQTYDFYQLDDKTTAKNPTDTHLKKGSESFRDQKPPSTTQSTLATTYQQPGTVTLNIFL